MLWILAENPVLQDYLAAQGCQPGNKEGRAPSATTAMITTRAMAGS